jgi:hypothetical protein
VLPLATDRDFEDPKMKNLTFYLPVVGVIFLCCVHGHDDGIPDSLTDAEVCHVIETCEVNLEQLEVVTEKMDAFCLFPDEEHEKGEDLILALNACQKTADEICYNPIFLVGDERFSNWKSIYLKRIKIQVERLEAASFRMADVVLWRADCETYDQELYERIETALRTSEIEPSFCDYKHCYWCQCRRILRIK